jgi:hypothetical protein
MNKKYHILLACCAVFFCAGTIYAQGWPDTCAHLYASKYSYPQTSQEYEKQYDTLRMYIERCAKNDDLSYRAFGSLGGAVQYMSDDPIRFDSLRAWLISVLYLNTTNPEYFCACLGTITGTYQAGKFDPLGSLAIDDYLKHYHRECWVAGSDEIYSEDSIYDYQHGFDPTHLPSLDSMGLGFLLRAGVHTSFLQSEFLTSFTTSPNPFIKETTLELTLSRMSYVTLAVFDDLGRLVLEYPGSSLEAGTHAIHLDGSLLPSGTLYARIATGFGEVKTVKLVHEK